MKARIQTMQIRSFMDLLEKIYSPDELKGAEVTIKEVCNGGFIIQCENLIKEIVAIDLQCNFSLLYEQLVKIMDTFYGELDLELEIIDNKEWLLDLKFKNKTIKVERSMTKYNFIPDITFKINWLDLVNTIKNNNEVKISKEGFNHKETFIVKFKETDKENLIKFIIASLGDDEITIKVKDDTVFYFEKQDGTCFRMLAEDVLYSEEGF